MTVFNEKVVDHTKEYMFFGEPLNVARYDKMKFPKFDKFVEQQLGYFWRPEEFGLTKDINDFNNKMSEKDRRIFVANLQYQILLDSVQGRSPSGIFGRICSLPELEEWLQVWSTFEVIHSKSYTHIIRNVFNDPSVVFDQIMLTPEIMDRARSVGRYYDELEERILVGDFHNWREDTKRKAKEALFKCMVSVYILEAIRFYVSFACSFSFAERGLMEGNAKIIQTISRDEYLHKGSTHFILTRWIRGLDDPEMTEIANKFISDGTVLKMFEECYNQEVAWAQYLMLDGAVPMLTEDVLVEYLGYVTKEAIDLLGIEQDKFNVTKNPIPWVDNHLKSESKQFAPQEGDLNNYIIGAVDMDTDMSDLDMDF